jgi:hypothetical protein
MNTTRHDVWLILAKVDVVGDNPANLTTGSEALVQCFIPETGLEVALAKADVLLEQKGMRRTDVLSCRRYDRGEQFDSDTPEFLKRDVTQVRQSGRPLTGTFFTSKDSASFKENETQ